MTIFQPHSAHKEKYFPFKFRDRLLILKSLVSFQKNACLKNNYV